MMQASGKLGALIAVTALFFAWGFVTSNNDPVIAHCAASSASALPKPC